MLNEPVDYAELAVYLKKTRGLEGMPVKTPYRSTWLDNTEAKFTLDWRPEYDLANSRTRPTTTNGPPTIRA